MPLYEFQQRAIDRVSSQSAPVRHLLAFDTGLGKSLTALLSLKALNAEKILIVCPAITRLGWLREIAKWWPERSSDAAAITEGRVRANRSRKRQRVVAESFEAPIQIVSYSLVNQVEATGWDGIVLDEVHYLKSPSSSQSKLIRELVRANSDATVLGLSATLMPDRISDLWNPLNTLWPKQWGRLNRNGKYSYQFNNRYMHKEETEYGLKWFGAKNTDELTERLDKIAIRVTRSEVAHMLPPYQVRKLDVLGPRLADVGVKLTQPVIERLLCLAGDKKAYEVPAWVGDAWDEGASHLLIFTYRKNLARALSADVKRRFRHDEYFGATITGDDSTEERNRLIDAWRNSKKGVLYATMDSCGTGVNGLEAAQRMLFAELHYRPEKIVQAMGRGNRLSSTHGTNIDIMVLSGTLDERIADVLFEKIAAINAAWHPDVTSQELEKQLGSLTPEAFDAALAQTLGSYIGDTE